MSPDPDQSAAVPRAPGHAHDALLQGAAAARARRQRDELALHEHQRWPRAQGELCAGLGGRVSEMREACLPCK